MNVIFLKSSLRDLDEIAAFIAEDNPIRALAFTDELVEKSLDIGLNPLSYPALIQNNNYRKKSYKGYIILYKIQNESVYITHIVSSMRDYSKLLK